MLTRKHHHKFKLHTRRLLVFVCVGLFGWFPVHAQPNIELLFEQILLHPDVNELLTNLETPVAVRLQDATPEALLLIQHYLNQRNVRVTTVYQNSSVLDFTFVSNNSLTRDTRKNYLRELNVHIGVSVIDADGEISDIRLLSVTHQDIITSQQIADFDSPWKPASFGTIVTQRSRTSRFLRQYIEPIAISSAIGTTIYLLYNVRSR